MHSSLACPCACHSASLRHQQPQWGSSSLPGPACPCSGGNQTCQLSAGSPVCPPASHGLAAHLACPLHAAPVCRDPATVCVANYPGCSTCGRCCNARVGRAIGAAGEAAKTHAPRLGCCTGLQPGVAWLRRPPGWPAAAYQHAPHNPPLNSLQPRTRRASGSARCASRTRRAT